MWALEQ